MALFCKSIISAISNKISSESFVYGLVGFAFTGVSFVFAVAPNLPYISPAKERTHRLQMEKEIRDRENRMSYLRGLVKISNI